MARSAIGLIETRGLVGVVEAADTAAKTANVELSGFEMVGGGLVSVRFRGDVASVQAAVQAGSEAAARVGELIASHVIPGPHADLVALLGDTTAGEAPAARPGTPPPPAAATADLQTLSVVKLRQLARRTPGVQLHGREISRANKQALIAALERARMHNS